MSILYDLAAEYGPSVTTDADTLAPALILKSGASGAAQPALHLAKTATGNQTVGLLRIAGSSLASGALIEFQGGFVSCTSIVLTTVANTDYAIPVQVGLETRYIPTFKAAAIVGGAAF